MKRVQDAVDFLQQTATEKVADKGVAIEVAAALQKIAQMLSGLDVKAGNGGTEGAGAAGATATTIEQPADGGTSGGERSAGIVTVRGSSPAKKLLLEKPPAPTDANAGVSTGDDTGNGNGGGKGCGGGAPTSQGEQSVYAGGAVDGEIVMGTTTEGALENADDLVAQAVAALGDDAADL